MARVVLNKKSISKKLIGAVNSNKRFSLKKQMNNRLENKKKKLIQSIISHPISRELNAGPYTSSGILSYGNLFSFLGFNGDDRPVDNLIDLIEKDIRITKAKVTSINLQGTKANIEYALYVPKLSDIERKTTLPWDKSRSWIRGIEVTGYDNFAYYLYDQNETFKNSRSGPAIQIKRQLRPIQNLAPQPYVLNEIEQFIKRLNRKS